jgi:hypothetical protein
MKRPEVGHEGERGVGREAEALLFIGNVESEL